MQSILYVNGSAGAGNASLMTVQTLRAPLATTIAVNTVSQVPNKFYGSMGTPHTFTDPVTSEVITVISDATAVDFAGSVSGGSINIDAIAPGYTDAGSKVGDIIIVRPITEWANNIANILAQSHNDDGTLKNTAITYSPFIFDHVASGAILAGLGYGSTLTASLSAGIAYINGIKQTITAVVTRAYTASKDTYVDALYNASGTATIVYTEVANNAASPALAVNSIRLGTVVSGASIVAATSIGQGNFTNTVPVIASQILRGFDSLGNLIYPKSASAGGQVKSKFSVYRTAAFNSSGLPGAVVQHDTKAFDTNNEVDVVTNKGRWTCKVAGFYFFTAQAGNAAATSTQIQSYLYKNGANVKNGQGIDSSLNGGQSGGVVSGFLLCAVGDYIEHVFAGGGGSAINVGAAACFFDGFMVSGS